MSITMNPPDVSVVVPTYKRPELLLRCLKALTKQQFDFTYEIIVVSDGPDRITETVLKKYEGKIIYLSLTEKKGPAAARNLGWRCAKGKLIAFTDDDCIPDTLWLTELWRCYLNEEKINLAITGKTIVPAPNPPTDYERNIKNLETAEFITANCALTKSALETVNGLDENFKLAWREDSDLQFRLMEHIIKIVKCDKAIVTHPVRKAPFAVSIKDEKKGIYNALLYKKFPTWYKERIQPKPPWIYYIIIFSFLSMLITMAISLKFLMALSTLIWISATAVFTMKRLKNTSKSPTHILEMIITSMIIPFVSIYYRICGSLKFKTLLLP